MNERFPNADGHNDYQHDGDPAESETETSREQQQLNPRIYVTKGLPLRAELTTGTWLDMARDPREIYAEMYAVLEDEASDGERLYIWDYRDFGAFTVTTGAIGLEGVDSIELLAQVARGIAEHGPAYAVWADVHEDDPHLFDHFVNAYKGQHETMAAYVRQMFEPLKIEATLRQVVPAGLENFVYIDYGAVGEEMLREGDIVAFPAEDGGVWIFDEKS
ncbi:antirestriction protein ArdA [Nocardia farcinica]|uniref:antirestriction protein ArdA n=1 Tax=Nocardia farcinica TaxID=37329 RepID=UPI00189308EA|nr:antirestriction protein ArdA [Nocardia farcinica]MBF6259856.1 antirestriction protein ArdA [Nocardia farcinica]